MKIAYMCCGLDPKCSGKLGCYKQSLPVFDPMLVCCHTYNKRYAMNPITSDPENDLRFERFVNPDGEICYFESNGELEREALENRKSDI